MGVHGKADVDRCGDAEVVCSTTSNHNVAHFWLGPTVGPTINDCNSYALSHGVDYFLGIQDENDAGLVHCGLVFSTVNKCEELCIPYATDHPEITGVWPAETYCNAVCNRRTMPANPSDHECMPPDASAEAKARAHRMFTCASRPAVTTTTTTLGPDCGEHGVADCSVQLQYAWLGRSSETGECSAFARAQRQPVFWMVPSIGGCGLVFDDLETCKSLGIEKPGVTCFSLVQALPGCGASGHTCRLSEALPPTTTTTTTRPGPCGQLGTLDCNIMIQHAWLGRDAWTGDCGEYAAAKHHHTFWSVPSIGGCGLVFNSVEECKALGIERSGATCFSLVSPMPGCMIGHTCSSLLV